MAIFAVFKKVSSGALWPLPKLEVIMPPTSLAYNIYNEYNRQQKSPDSFRIKALLDNTERIRTLFGGERGIRNFIKLDD